jgi:medium-chain acyl-[acyl-carrier-protein] hydrolase
VTSNASRAEPWVRLRRRPSARGTLLCFPYSGAGAPAFRALAQLMGDDVEVAALTPAGRGHRLREPPAASVAAVASDALAGLAPLTPPFVLYGHSLGALVAFELARQAARAIAVRHLVVAARGAPDVPVPLPHVHTLPDADLVRVMESYGATPQELLANPELLAAALPAVRADLALSEKYTPEPGALLAVPLTALGGSADGSIAPAAIDGWQRHTSGPFTRGTVVGGHFFLNESLPALVDVLVPLMRAALAAS